MTNKKTKIKVISVIAALVLLFGIACLLKFTVGKNKDVNKDSSANVEVTVSNEADLREMLLRDATMTITVTDDMVIEEGFIVNGKKTLKGDAEIEMYIGAAFDQSIFTVSPEATLTMDGLVLDGNHLSDGITVSDGAELTYLSGKMIYTETFGIIADGNVTIKDIVMDHAQEGTVKASSGATVSMEGGSYLNTWYGGVYVEKGGNMTIGGDTVMDGSIVQSMVHNEGNLKITGGTFKNAGAYAVRNYGQLDVAYEGNKEDGYIEFTSNSRAAIRTEDGAVSNVSDIYVHDTRSNALVAVGGESNITDSRIEKTGDHGIEIQKGTAVIKNVTVTDTTSGGGVYAGPSSNVEVENFTATKVASNGIGCKSGTVTAKNVTVISPGRYGIACGNSSGAEIGKATITGSQITDAGKFGVYVYGSSEAKVVDINIKGFTQEETTGIFIATKASCTLEGNSIIEGAKQRGVKVLGTFTMNGGTIRQNIANLNGAGMYVGPVAVFTMNGGEMSNNVNATRNAGAMMVDGGKVTIDGGKILDNSTSKAGGAIYAYNGATVYLKSGKIDGNIAGSSGDGIYFKGENTKVTVGKNFYMGDNDIRVATTEVMLDIESDTLTKHSASKPLLVTPGDTFEEGTKVVRCSSAAVATKLESVVKSGDGSFKLNKNDKYYEIEYTKADMDMTGADTVYVSNFEELKAAITGTTSKRYIVLKADIAMESSIRVPGGTTICIKDDGNVRKLIRAEGMTDKFLTTIYGTGLYLQGTEDGNLILDGTCSTGVEAKDCGSLVYTAGSTVVKGVILQNNGAAVDGSKGRGALLNQWYGDISIYNSVLSGGAGYTGGALIVSNASGYIENSTFKNNKTIVGGGAIRMEKSAKLEIVASTFVGNTAGSTGGAIVSTDAKKLTVTDTTFDSNTAKKGGAVSAVGTDNYAFFNGSEGSEVALFTNNSASDGENGKGGAIYAEDTVQIMVDGYNFMKNAATGYGGAVCAKDATSSVILTNSTFYENTAGNSGAAVACEGSKMDIISCEIGKENAGNVATSKGGAFIVYKNGVVRMSLGAGSDYKTLAYNEAKVGGAICVLTGNFYLNGYTIANNSARDGAGMYIYAGAAAETKNATYRENNAEKNYGGAACVYGSLKSTDDTYEANNARVGGAAFIGEDASAEFAGTTGVFKANVSETKGGAIHAHDRATLKVDGYTFTDNTAVSGNAIRIHPNAVSDVRNCSFSVTDGSAKITNSSTLTFSNLAGVTLEQQEENALFVTDGSVAEDSDLTITPKNYTEGIVVLGKTEKLSVEDWTAAYTNIAVTTKADLTKWILDAEGKLQKDSEPVAMITNRGSDYYYYSLSKAISAATTIEAARIKRGEEALQPIVITLLRDITIDAKVSLEALNLVIQNKLDTNIKISRGNEFSGHMFILNENATLTLGSSVETEQGTLIVDGEKISVEEGRMIYVNHSSATFVLQKNATLQNAVCGASGAALVNLGTCNLYGTIKDNESTAAGTSSAYAAGAILQRRGSGSLTIYGGTYTGNKNTGSNGGGGLIGTQTTNTSGTSAGPITIMGGTFSSNSAKYGGVLFVYTTQKVTISGGTFTANQATSYGGVIHTLTADSEDTGVDILISGGNFTGNTGTAGGVVSLMDYGTLEITGGTFTQNGATKAGGGVVFVQNATATVSGATMTGNCAKNGSGYFGGGAIAMHKASTVTISNCAILGNVHSGVLSDTSQNENGCDIAFSGSANQTLILKDKESLGNGSVGHMYTDLKASKFKTCTVQFDYEPKQLSTIAHGKRYSINCVDNTITEK